MGEDELEELREKKRKELQEQENQQEQQEEQVKQAAKKFLTSEAQSRMENVRTARPEQASMIEQRIVMLGRSQKVQGKIDDSQLKEILKDLNDKDSDYNIKHR